MCCQKEASPNSTAEDLNVIKDLLKTLLRSTRLGFAFMITSTVLIVGLNILIKIL